MIAEARPISPLRRLRRRVYEVLEVGRGEDKISQAVDTFLMLLVLTNVLAFMLETVPSIEAAYGEWLWRFEVFSVVVFTIEYGLRLWSCVEMPFLGRINTWRARLRFAQRPFLIIDLLAILPFYLSLFVTADLRILRLLRVFRFLKLARYSPAIDALLRVLVNERRALAGSFLLMMILLLFVATGMYFIERTAQPDAFGTIPDAAWWAMATLTTVGYGDVSPITPAGKFFGGLVMLIGLGMFALPIAIISTGFSQEVTRRDFVVTWPLVARIPILAELDAAAIADLMPHLRAHSYPPRWEIVTAGAPAEAMFFIASGTVRTRTSDGEVMLGVGDFFGEIGVLTDGRYAFSAVSESRVRALELEQEDFQRLENANPGLAARIRQVAAERTG